MGKSNKKIKSDRINALRKQYDAFVEEDKKRKERNEYILGRLNKMRYSAALVPVRNKSNPLMSRSSTAIHPHGYQEVARDLQPSAIPLRSQIIPDTPINKIDDNYLIQEITKNYILIPKLRSPFMNYIQQASPIHDKDILHDIKDVQQLNDSEALNVKPNTANENADWKSKYEILNILKKEETENEVVQLLDDNNHLRNSHETVPKNDIPLNNIYKSVAPLKEDKISADMNIDAGYKYLDDLPEKDMPVRKDNRDKNIYHEINDSVIAAHAVEPVLQTDTQDSNEVLAAVEEIGYGLQNTHLQYNYSDVNDANPAGEGQTYAEQEEYIYTEPTDPNAPIEQMHFEGHFQTANDTNAKIPPAEQNIEVTESVYAQNDLNPAYESDIQQQMKCEDPENSEYVDEQDAKPIQVISSNDLMEQINNNVTVSKTEPTDYIGQESENINIQELSPSVDLQMKGIADRTSEKVEIGQAHDDVVPGESQESTPQTVTEIHKEMPVKEEQMPDASDLEAYEAQQQQIFYSDHPNMDYDYEQVDGSPYDQAQAEAPIYPQTQEYSYYENTEPQQYLDLGENEEQNSRYDQSFPEQYVDPYVSAYEKEPQQEQPYEETQYYEEIQPEVFQQQDQQNDDNPVNQGHMQVESELDIEDGYVQQYKDTTPQAEPGPVKS